MKKSNDTSLKYINLFAKVFVNKLHELKYFDCIRMVEKENDRYTIWIKTPIDENNSKESCFRAMQDGIFYEILPTVFGKESFESEPYQWTSRIPSKNGIYNIHLHPNFKITISCTSTGDQATTFIYFSGYEPYIDIISKYFNQKKKL